MTIFRQFTLNEFTAFFREAVAEHRVHEAKALGLEAIAAMIEKKAKSFIGTYQLDWEQLAPATQAERARKGYPENEPLLRTGELRDSISHQIIEPGKLAEVGSTSDVAVFHEFGTATIPPRPFLLPAAISCEQPAEKLMAELVVPVMFGEAINTAIWEIAMESLKHLGHSAEKAVDAMENGNDDSKRH